VPSVPGEIRFAVSVPGEIRFAVSVPGEIRFAVSVPGEIRFAVSVPGEIRFAVSVLDLKGIHDGAEGRALALFDSEVGHRAEVDESGAVNEDAA
jgi:hypothetical protein